jgi:hypothetical protein
MKEPCQPRKKHASCQNPVDQDRNHSSGESSGTWAADAEERLNDVRHMLQPGGCRVMQGDAEQLLSGAAL